MLREGGTSECVFVGSKDGALRAYRITPGHDSLVPAGCYNCGDLSFFALGRRIEDGSVWVFVSGNFSLRALIYCPSRETFREVAETRTSGSGTHLTTNPGDPDLATYQTLFVAHYHQNVVSAFRYCEQDGFSDEALTEPGKHAHQTRVRGAFLYVPCLGSNHIAQYRIVPEPGLVAPRLLPLEPPCAFAPGGPRHMAFFPRQPKALLLCELESRLELFDIGADGELGLHEDASLFLHSDGGAHWSSDVAICPDGKFAYALNRDPPELVCLALAQDGRARRKSALALSAPVRSFGMAPDGSYLYAGGEDGLLHTISISAEMSVRSTLSGLGPIRHAEVVFFGRPLLRP